mgnify:CR=1 FL=1
MSFLVSPGVSVREVDLTNVVPAVATSVGAIAGAFQKGPVSSVVSVGSEEELLQKNNWYKYSVNQIQVILKHFLPLQTFYNMQII